MQTKPTILSSVPRQILLAIALSLFSALAIAEENPSSAASIERTQKTLQNLKFGIMINGFPEAGTSPELWNRQVDSFDVDRLSDSVKAAGIGYVMLSLGQNSGHYCAPNKTYDDLLAKAGRQPAESLLSKRDLPLELGRALKKRGIGFLLYLPMRSPQMDPFAMKALGDSTKQLQPATQAFTKNWQAIIREWSLRYGDLCMGWWFDGCYVPMSWNYDKDFNFATHAEAVHAGNPASLIAFNIPPQVQNTPIGTYPKEATFIAGHERGHTWPETHWTNRRFTNAFYNMTPAKDHFPKDLLWHLNTYMGYTYAIRAEGVDLIRVAKTTRSDAFWIDYITRVNQEGGIVTIDVCVASDGTISPDHYQQLKAIGRGLDRIQKQLQQAAGPYGSPVAGSPSGQP